MKNKVKVVVKPRGVFFSIDHQTFHLHVEPEDDTPKERRRAHQWYARQLRIAFKRLDQSYGKNRKVRR